MVTTTHLAVRRAAELDVSVEQMKRDVAEADVAQRKSKAKPRWAWLPEHDTSRGGHATEGTWRYLWTEDELRAYLCIKRATGWRVITVLRNVDWEAAA